MVSRGALFLPALAIALAGPGCVVKPDVYGESYPCSGEGADTCAEGNACFSSTGGNFCAPTCDEAGGCAEGSLCTDQGLCIETCAASGECPTGLTCIISDSGGYCATGYTCANDDDCRKIVNVTGTQCSSNVVDSGNSCLFGCRFDFADPFNPVDRGDCPAGQRCSSPGVLGIDEITMQPIGLCVFDCTTTGGCPPTYACVEAPAIGLDATCFGGIGGFACTSDVNCLIGSCETVGDGAGELCTIPCEIDADCNVIETEVFQYVCDHTGPQGYCSFAGEICDDLLCNSLAWEFCIQALVPQAPPSCLQNCQPPFLPCEAPADCIDIDPLDLMVSGLCLEPCATPADCPTDWGCVPNVPQWGPFAGHCLVGAPFVGCEPAGNNCLDGLDCVPYIALGDFCQAPCTTDSDCDWLEAVDGSTTWTCTLDVGEPTLYCEQAP